MFDDPQRVIQENYFVEDQGEQRHHVIGVTRSLVLISWCSWIAARTTTQKSFTSFQPERQTKMSKVFTQTSSSVKRIGISDKTREACANRDKSLDSTDPDCPAAPVCGKRKFRL